MNHIFKTLWRQRQKYLLLLLGLAIGALTVTAVSVISTLAQSLLNDELDAMGLNGLIVTSSNACITDTHLQSLENQSYIAHRTPLCYAYGKAAVGEKAANSLLWGMNDSAYQTVSLQLLHGRRLSDPDKGSHLCMVDKSLAISLYGRENIVGRELTVTVSGMAVQLTVIGVVDTGGSLTSMLMGNELPSFLYLPMDLLQLYTGKQGYDQLMLRLDDSLSPEEACLQVASLVYSEKGENKVQNMEQSKETISGILDLFSYVLFVFGCICFLTCALFAMTLMVRNVREQTAEIGIKKALGATDLQICAEYLAQAAVLSLLGSLIGALTAAGLSILGMRLLSLSVPFTVKSFLLPSLPGCLFGMVCGILPAYQAAKIHPGSAISQL